MKAISLLVICAVILGCAETQKSSKIKKTEPIIPVAQEPGEIKSSEAAGKVVMVGNDPSVTISVKDAVDHTLTYFEKGHGSPEHPVLKGGDKGYVEFLVSANKECTYNLYATYATKNKNAVNVYVNKELVLKNVGTDVTDGWGLNDAKQFKLGTVTLGQGENKIKLKNESGRFSHLFSITLNKSTE